MFFSCLDTWHLVFLSCRLLLFFLLVQEQSKKRHLILVSGFIHDVRSFIDEHPGGPHLLIKMIGKDATTAFFGGVYDHSNAAHNISCIFRPSTPFTLIYDIYIIFAFIPATHDEMCGHPSRRYFWRVPGCPYSKDMLW